tara:strand:- start:965 stop:2476 length:1512 start_codon:yes stop_codon:yes gene_type:complete
MASSQVVKSLVLRSSLNLKAISESSKSFSSGIKKASGYTRDISESLQKSVISKRKLIANDQSFFRKRRDAVKRKENESIIEAAGISGSVKRSAKIISDSTKGLFGRVLDFVGYTMAGWLITQLPMIIKGASELMMRIQKVVDRLSRFTNTIVGIFTGLDFDLEVEKSKIDSIRLQENANDLNKEGTNLGRAMAGLESQIDEGAKEVNTVVDEENKNRKDEEDENIEGKNQWWDPLNLVPNKKEEVEEEKQEQPEVEVKKQVQPQEELIPTKKKQQKKEDLFADEPDYENDRESWNEWNQKESDALKNDPESSGFDMFKDGGIIKGKSHKEGGKNINVEGGEAVIPKKSVDSYGPEFINRIIQNKEQDNVTKLRAARSLMEKLVDQHKEDNMGSITIDEFDKIKEQTMDKLKQSLSGFTKEITQTVSTKANKELVKAIEPTKDMMKSLSTPRKGSVIYMLNNQGGSGSSSPSAPPATSKKTKTIVINHKRDMYKKIASTLYAYT